VDGEWVVAEDLNGVSTLATEADGRYKFTVAPTHYDAAHPGFLTAREYRVSAERLGNQQWSPVCAGDYRTFDSDVIGNVQGDSPQLRGHSGQFSIVDLDPNTGWANAASFRDDVEMDVGMTSYVDSVVIGGRVWEDANVDGLQDEAEESVVGQVVTL